MLEVELTS